MDDIVNGIINMIAANAAANAETETEYLAEDGLLHCKVCGGPRQTVIRLPMPGAMPRTVRCWCNCPTEIDRRREAKRVERIARNREKCFKNAQEYREWTFPADDGKGAREAVQTAKAYAEDFALYRRDGKGLLLYGGVGTGKTFLAACIANELLDKGYSVRMTSLGTIADELWAVEDKAEYLLELSFCSLVILDDLGTERSSAYMDEMVFKIINALYSAGTPVIVTTNLTPQELAKPGTLKYSRIYDRLLEVCLPVKVDGPSRRRSAAADTWTQMRKQMGTTTGGNER